MISNRLDSLSICSMPLFRNFSHSSKYFTVSSRECTPNKYAFSVSSENSSTCDSSAQLELPFIKKIYNELITAPKWLTNSEWSAFGEKLDIVTKQHLLDLWPTMLLSFIAQETEAVPGLYSVGMSLVDYVASLSERNRLPRIVSSVAICIHQGGENCYEKALAVYDELRAEYDIFDHVSARMLLVALAKTRYWRHCLDLIDMIKITACPSASDYSAVIIAAMVNHDYALANELLEMLSRIGYVPDDKVFMHMCNSGTAEQVLTLLKDFAWIPSEPVIDYVISQLQRYVHNLSMVYHAWCPEVCLLHLLVMFFKMVYKDQVIFVCIGTIACSNPKCYNVIFS